MKKMIVLLLSASIVISGMTGCAKTQKTENASGSTDTNSVQTKVDSNNETSESEHQEVQAYSIFWSKYDDLLDQSKSFFVNILGDENKAKEVYDQYFLKFNIIHEASHVIQREQESIMATAEQGDMFSLERRANDMAIAYWKMIDPEFVNEIEKIVDHFLNTLENPVPEGQDMGKYFNENIGELASNPAAYGYYQFYFVKEAIKLNESYYEIVKEHIDPNLKDYEGEVTKKDYVAGNVENIIQGYVDFAALYGIDVKPIISVEEASPQIQHMSPSENPDMTKAITASIRQSEGKINLEKKNRSHGDELLASLDNVAKNGIVVIYSDGYDNIALQEQERLLGMKEFYYNIYNTNVALELAILDRADWEKGGDNSDRAPPYGIPHVDHNEHDYTIYVPATDDGALVGFAMQYKDQITDTIRNNFSEAGYAYEDGVKLFPKLIGLHEVGHTFVDSLGMKDLEFWFNEFMATYFTYAYLAETDEALAKLWVANGDVAFLDGKAPKHSSLEDLNQLGTGVGVEEYDWYQKEFAKLAKKVYEIKGIDFIDEVVKMYNSTDYSSTDTINQLEKIVPIFKDWEKELVNFNK